MKRIQCHEPCTCLERAFAVCPEWAGLEAAELERLVQSVSCIRYDLGEVIYHEGAECQGVYFVIKGLIGVRKADPGGDDTLLWLAGSGDTLAYRALLAGERHRDSAEVLKPVTVCHIPSPVMMRMIRSNARLGVGFLQRAARELGRTEERLHETITLTARCRLAHLLLLFSGDLDLEEGDPSPVIELPISRSHLASLLGVRRESLSRLIRGLEEDGIAQFNGRHVRLLHARALLDEYRLESGASM